MHVPLVRLGLLVALVITTVGLASDGPPVEAQTRPVSAVGQSPAPPLLFVENDGQFDRAVRFQAQGAGMTLWVTEHSVWLTKLEAIPSASSRGRGGDPLRDRSDDQTSGPRRGVHLQLTFPGHGGGVRLVASDPRPTRMNYFLRSDPGRWRSGVRTYGAVTWHGLSPGVSVTLTEAGGEPALVVEAARRSDLPAVRLRVTGAEALRVTLDARVVAETAIGDVPLPPVLGDGVPLGARIDGSEVSFTGPRGTRPVPGVQASQGIRAGKGLLYGTFLGGSDDDEYNGVDLAVGPDGSTFVAGTTFSADFPTTPGAFDTTYDDDVGFAGDAYVSRLDPTGSTLLYSTFLGGGSTEDLWSLAVGPDGSAYVGGNTRSQDYPTTSDSFSPTFNGGCCDGFVTKLNPEGSALVYSTYLGGSESTESVRALALGPDGSVYATGETLSADFPTTPGAFDTTINNDGVCCLYEDAFVAALNPAGTDLLYSTFLGGSFNDIGRAIAVGSDGTAYATGFAQSRDFPTTPGAFDQTFNGGNNDLFVTRVDQTGSALAFSTYLGGNDWDEGTAIAFDATGNVYVTGHTSSPDYPTTPGAYDRTINSYILTDIFATKLNADGSALFYSTFLGGNEGDYWPDMLLNPDGTVTLTGTTDSENFPTTPGAFDRTFGTPSDAFVVRFDPTGSRLLYGSFLGGSGRGAGEAGDAIAPAGPGRVSVGGSTEAENFPVTPGAYDPTYNGGADAFVATLRVAPTVHVDRIVPSYHPVGEGYVVGAGIRILSQTGAPVEGAEITVEIASPDGSEIVATGETSPRGIAAVARPASETGTYTFTVLAVARTGAAYDPSQNGETSDSVTIP